MGKHETIERWEPKDDLLLTSLVAEYGPKWQEITKKFPGRTDKSVRNRYLRLNTQKEGKNLCTKCGEVKRGHICRGEAKQEERARHRSRRICNLDQVRQGVACDRNSLVGGLAT